MLFGNLKEVLHTIALRYFVRKKLSYGHIGRNSHIHTPSIVSRGVDNIYLGDNCNIDWNNVLYCDSAKFIMKDYSGAAVGLTVVTGNHTLKPNERVNRKNNNDNLEGKDIIVEEEVWIAANVTLLAGAHIGRGAIVGAGSVVRNCNVPPYSIVCGNPAKVIGFKWSVEEIIEHENMYYEESERISPQVIKENYDKYFLKRFKEIKTFLKL